MQVKKKMKKPLLIAILAAILAVLTALAILLNTILAADSGNDPDDGEESLPEILEGEDIYANSAIAYPRIEENDIDAIRIYADNEYIFKRDTSSVGKTESEDGKEDDEEAYYPFVLFYYDSEIGEFTPFNPGISFTDPSFEYDDMLAVETNDGYGTIKKLTYLCTAVGTAYFDERIAVDEDNKEEDLAIFGLSEEDKPLKLEISYVDSKGKAQKHVIKLGDKLITGTGYYFTVDDRNYVYSTNVPYFDYAFLSFTEYINPRLVAAGLPQDNAFEPYLTTDFRQWKNEIVGDDENEADSIVPEDSKVIVTATTYGPVYISSDPYNSYDDGYLKSAKKSISFELWDYLNKSEGNKIFTSLAGGKLGALDEPLMLTIPNYSNTVTLSEDGAKYEYEITAIEAILTDSADNTAKGTPVADNDIVKISYELKINGKSASSETCHGVIDLSDDTIPEAARTALRAASVGELGERVKFTIDYNDKNTVKRTVQMVITEITGIEPILTGEELEDDVKDPTEVKLNTTVAYRYYLVVDGERVQGTASDAIRITEGLEGDSKLLADALMGQKKSSELNIVIDAYSTHCERIASFTAYEITDIEYFVTRELIVSFAFEQASKRDPYYGESLYSNTMDGHKYELYALNSASCESILRILGGLETSATSSTGLVGVRTVDIGLSADKMKKYGLYANTLYFELPRGITNIKYDDVPDDEYLSTLDDYTYYSTLGFMIYISDVRVRADGSLFRYIASDMYDVISEVDAEKFFFLDEGFTDFYARKELVLTDISDISKVDFDFFMTDIYGSYSNELIHNELYAYGGKVYSRAKLIAEFGEEALAYATEFDSIDVVVTPDGECIDTKLSDAIADKNENRKEGVDEYTYLSLRELYDSKFVELESVGTANFKEFIETLFYVHYEGNLTEEEQNEAEGALLMKMNVSLYEGYSSYSYAYEFYRISDRRVMVKIYRENMNDGTKIQEVSDFYISTFSFKRIVNTYISLLNGETLDNDTVVYPEG